MYHALLVSELVRDICSALDQSSLPALARTCRSLCDPALDELWRDLYSIYPFIHLLNQPSSLHQWSTLRKYSTRTRSLYMCVIDDLPYHFPPLSNPPDPHTFFPNLRTIAWYPTDHLAMLPFFRLLCGPALTTLSFESATDPASLAMVANLGTLCPNITDIAISASSESLSYDLANAFSISICCWKDLRHVSCDDLSFPAMEHLGRLDNLESFTTCALGRISSSPPPLRVQELSFPRLQYLHLYTGLLSTTTAYLKSLHLALREFRLDLFDAEEVSSSASYLRALSTALSQACSHTCLVRLYLCVIHPHFPSPDTVATIRDVRPLLHFTHLRVLSFEGLSTLSFNDDDIAELASAWPSVEELALSTYVNHPVASLPTFRSLLHLVDACPRLRTLSLVVDATSLPSFSFGATARSDLLDELCLGNSPIRCPRAVGRTLRHLYPSLKQVDLSVWNKEPLNRLPRRDRYEMSWATVNVELQSARGIEPSRPCISALSPLI